MLRWTLCMVAACLAVACGGGPGAGDEADRGDAPGVLRQVSAAQLPAGARPLNLPTSRALQGRAVEFTGGLRESLDCGEVEGRELCVADAYGGGRLLLSATEHPTFGGAENECESLAGAGAVGEPGTRQMRWTTGDGIYLAAVRTCVLLRLERDGKVDPLATADAADALAKQLLY